MLIAGLLLMASAHNVTSGRDLLAACKEPGFDTWCDGFIKGLMDAALVKESKASERSCVVPELGMRQRRILMLEHLNQHSDQWELPAATVVNRVIAANWPNCT
ncbi:Rap1a/Tai family immunity protein [Sphingomonas lacusdianchii]|uniref:Rap1a/Tai family immunity protein n=1 Tax=Sphingomonas lacusdianchii TaxID=2917992 RepID=UPI001F5AFAAF|nr:Rap1a/Tai family immunity protein [Sphingomonas sp. JXJ CY 53]